MPGGTAEFHSANRRWCGDAPWIDAIRATIPGKLVLGNTFSWPDLPTYVRAAAAKYYREAAAFIQTNEGFDEECVVDMLEAAKLMEAGE